METFIICLSLLGVLGVLPINAHYDELPVQVQWKRLQFAYPTEADRENAIRNGVYDPDSPLPIDIDVYYKPTGRNSYERMMFVTIPKFNPGVPVTLGTISRDFYEADPVIEPFPSWEWHRDTNKCSSTRLVSVFRVKIDRCGLLWILDSGSDGNEVICKPQIVVFDLKQWPQKKTPYYRYEYPDSVYNKSISTFVTPVVESYGSDCKDGAFVYAADTSTRQIVVTDLNSKYSKSISDHSMWPDPVYENFEIAGQTFSLDDGILGIDISPVTYNNDKYLLYSPLGGVFESYVSTNEIKKLLMTSQKPKFQSYRTPRRSQSAGVAISREGIAFFGLVSNLTMNCWNVFSNDYGKYINEVYYNPVTMQFPSGVKIVENPYGYEELWVMTNRFQKMMNNGYNFNQVNFRVSMGYVQQLVEGTKCTRPSH